MARLREAALDLMRAAGEQLACECQSDVVIAPGDENGGVFNFHGKLHGGKVRLT